MNTMKFSEAMNEIDDKYVEEAAVYKAGGKNHWIEWTSVIAACIVLASFAAFYMNGEPKIPVDSGTEPTVTTPWTDPNALNSADYILNQSFTPAYDAEELVSIPASGEPQSYEELQEYIKLWDTNFVEYEILFQYSKDEAYEKTGDDNFLYGTTLYRAHIYYDHLNRTPLDLTVDISKAGLPERQFEGNPPYAVGQRLASPLSRVKASRWIAMPELTYCVYNVNGVDLAYHLGGGEIILSNMSIPNLEMELFEGERSFVTTTRGNPAAFTQKSTLEALTEFIRKDWSARGYAFADFNELADEEFKNEIPPANDGYGVYESAIATINEYMGSYLGMNSDGNTVSQNSADVMGVSEEGGVLTEFKDKDDNLIRLRLVCFGSSSKSEWNYYIEPTGFCAYYTELYETYDSLRLVKSEGAALAYSFEEYYIEFGRIYRIDRINECLVPVDESPVPKILLDVLNSK